MKRMLRFFLVATLVFGVTAAAAFANGSQEKGSTQNTSVQKSKGNVQLVYVEWARAVAITHVAGVILEDLGYKVKTNSVANAAMWASVASGDADALLCAWLPNTHKDLYAKYKSDIIDVGHNYNGAKLGLVVPSYVPYNTIAELSQHAAKFDKKIIGIDPGAGEMQETEKAVKNNVEGLGAFKVIEGSGPAMTAALGAAIKNKQPIVVTGWKPHWMFGRWDLKILKDTAGIYGSAEHIDTIVTKDLPQKKPGVYKFLSNFDWKKLDLGPVLVWNKDGMDPHASAQKFVNQNKDKINSLLPDGMHI